MQVNVGDDKDVVFEDPALVELRAAMVKLIRGRGLPVATQWSIADGYGILAVNENGIVLGDEYASDVRTTLDRLPVLELARLIDDPVGEPELIRIVQELRHRFEESGELQKSSRLNLLR